MVLITEENVIQLFLKFSPSQARLSRGKDLPVDFSIMYQMFTYYLHVMGLSPIL